MRASFEAKNKARRSATRALPTGQSHLIRWAGGRDVQKGKGGNPGWVIGGKPVRDAGTAIMGADLKPFVAKNIHKRNQIARHGAFGIGFVIFVRGGFRRLA